MPRPSWSHYLLRVASVLTAFGWCSMQGKAQMPKPGLNLPGTAFRVEGGSGASSDNGQHEVDDWAEAELQKAIKSCREGKFQEALPRLRAIQGRVEETYAAGFNLALAYVGVGDYAASVDTLTGMRANGENTAAVNNLLSQAYIGEGDRARAFASFEEAVKLTPLDEKLYVYVADACTDHFQYALGLRVVEMGLEKLPNSARLHYERAIFLARLDRLSEARDEFQRTISLAPGDDISYLARVQDFFYSGDLQSAVRVAREAVQGGHRDYQMLGLLGDILLRNGASVGEPEFVEARTLLEASVLANPNYSTSQLSLGRLYLMEERFSEAEPHLQAAERLEPMNPAVYISLAADYRRLGQPARARNCIRNLSAILQQEAAQR